MPSQKIDSIWLIRLRWGAIVGQTAVVAGVYLGLNIPLPLLPIFSIIGLEVLINIISYKSYVASNGNAPLFSALTLVADILCLTGLLYWSGGSSNPFTLLYLVHVPLTVIMLGEMWAWLLILLAATGFGALFRYNHHIHALMHGAHDDQASGMNLHYIGMWVAFVIAATFILYFTSRISRELAKRQQLIHELERKTFRSEKLASLATLAAGTAHELATPLSTIAVVANEFEKAIGNDTEKNLREDARVIRSEVDRCRSILQQMAADGGQVIGDSLENFTMADVLHNIVAELPFKEQINMRTEPGCEHILVKLPLSTFRRAFVSILKNAHDASSRQTPIEVYLRQEDCFAIIEISDQGEGIEQDKLSKVTEPFYSTKEAGKGMGLGLFLTQTVLQSLNGTLEIQSTLGKGTTVTMQIPQLATYG